MERFGGLAKRPPENDKERAEARAESERLEQLAKDDVDKSVRFLREVISSAGSYRESIPHDARGEINRESFTNIHTGRSLLERATSVPLTVAGFNEFMAKVESRCPDYAFTLEKKDGFFNLSVEAKK